jgi:hypothetical protein
MHMTQKTFELTSTDVWGRIRSYLAVDIICKYLIDFVLNQHLLIIGFGFLVQLPRDLITVCIQSSRNGTFWNISFKWIV